MQIDGFSQEQIEIAIKEVSKKDLVKPLPKANDHSKPTLYIFRHGQSEDNKEFLFSGWRNPNISDLGREQAETLADKLADAHFDLAISSNLNRARQTLEIVLAKNKSWSNNKFPTTTDKYQDEVLTMHLAKLGNIESAYPKPNSTPDDKKYKNLQEIVKIVLDDRVIERSYGDLQGTSKVELHLKDPASEDKYRRGYDSTATNGESLKMVEIRAKLFLDELLPYMKEKGISVVVSCHSNSMRAVRRFMENLTIEEMCRLENPTGVDYASYNI